MKSKKLGWAFIILSLLFINIIPDPTDALTLPIYSAFTGADISPSNLSSVYLDFLGWSLLVGFGFLLAGMYLMGWDFRRLFKKLDINKYKTFIGLAILSVVVVVVLNIKSIYLFFLIPPILYYIFIHQDKSESVGIYGSSLIIFYGGTPTLIQHIINRTPVPEILPHLNSHTFLSWLAVTLGFTQVNNLVLFIGIFISFLAVILLTKTLKDFL